jgi:hypothetical protein
MERNGKTIVKVSLTVIPTSRNYLNKYSHSVLLGFSSQVHVHVEENRVRIFGRIGNKFRC